MFAEMERWRGGEEEDQKEEGKDRKKEVEMKVEEDKEEGKDQEKEEEGRGKEGERGGEDSRPHRKRIERGEGGGKALEQLSLLLLFCAHYDWNKC